MVDYLDAKYGKENPLTPSDPEQAAEVRIPLSDQCACRSKMCNHCANLLQADIKTIWQSSAVWVCSLASQLSCMV